MHRAERKLGFFVSFAYTDDAEREVRRFNKAQAGKHEIVLYTVQQILDDEIERATG